MDKKVYIAYAIVFFAYLGSFLRLPIIPLYASELGADKFEIGIITFGFMLTAFILAFPMGFSSDKFGRKKLILLGLFLNMVSSLILFMSENVLEIFFANIVGGAGVATFAPSLSSYVGDISKRLGKAYGYFTACMQSGMAAGPLMGGILADALGYVYSFLISALIIFICIPISLFISEVYMRRPKESFFKNLYLLLRERKISGSWIAVLSVAFAFGVFMPFFPLYASEVGYSTSIIGLFFMIQAFFNALSRIPVGYLADAVERKNFIPSFSMIVLSLLIFILPNFKDFYSLVLISAFIGFSMGSSTTVLSTILAENSPPRLRGLTMSGFNAFLYLGFALSSFICGYFVNEYGYFYGFSLGSLTCLLGAFIFIASFFNR